MKKSTQQWWKLLIYLAVLVIFLGLRTFSLQKSFWFFGDLGRDLFVLQDWANHPFHPPLLGPQTSVVSFNQTAGYYYYLFPFFLISGQSAYSTLIATLALYVGLIIGAFVIFKNKKHWQPVAALLFLIAIHPQFVIQHRYVWNPSLVTPFLLIGFWGWWRYRSRADWRWLLLMAFSWFAATGLNFSLTPTVLVMILLFFWEQRKNWRVIGQFILLSILANLIIHAPTIIFEFRHDFLLTRNLPTQELLQQETLFSRKVTELISHVFLPERSMRGGMQLSWVIAAVFIFCVWRFKALRHSWVLIRSLQIAILTALLMLLTPFRMHEHYVFGSLTFLLVALARLPKQILFIVLIGLSILYLRPFYFQFYAKPAPHLIAEQKSCIQQTCEIIKLHGLEPIFVNTHSSSHNHQAREYIFWLKNFGCQAIDTQQFNATPTNYMVVVSDRAEFENGKTGYYELSQFGEAVELEQISCKENLKIHLLKKL
ncbi:MAG: hypothetical protein A2383_02185 [Candidatus Pacebacteria bacterium RIFOXYB1_FULL_39_46]|nr:MAG: hypothetical protein A2383_02185 [Candidatus Pacebacteria bacterium RIFOXYB1_FULL_39_46]OGJ39125.1 MAG: hypothetical protein A2182_02265 [Candidatus Pacebacteria bacterium RIFOXYA1_FULL_38_18]OGJ40175.1 MAG: hypothetical protein A2582_03740 [Candidatus Pacebacteria bacterium RIFOXYD1_FULL_39_27]OGJ41058.1 MAG: hypothetical protein A2411_01085 [Candidatus Pacebacteria bacterium RIFOXYC1_FULL_39_21]